MWRPVAFMSVKAARSAGFINGFIRTSRKKFRCFGTKLCEWAKTKDRYIDVGGPPHGGWPDGVYGPRRPPPPSGRGQRTRSNLAWVEEDCGAARAHEAARELVLFLRRPGGQPQVSVSLAKQASEMMSIRELQTWVA